MIVIPIDNVITRIYHFNLLIVNVIVSFVKRIFDHLVVHTTVNEDAV